MNKGFRFICISFLTAISPLFLSSCSQNKNSQEKNGVEVYTVEEFKHALSSGEKSIIASDLDFQDETIVINHDVSITSKDKEANFKNVYFSVIGPHVEGEKIDVSFSGIVFDDEIDVSSINFETIESFETKFGSERDDKRCITADYGYFSLSLDSCVIKNYASNTGPALLVENSHRLDNKTVTLNNCKIHNNYAEMDTVHLSNDKLITNITNSEFFSNHAYKGSGFSIANGVATIDKVNVHDNIFVPYDVPVDDSQRSGGGVYIGGTDTKMTNSYIVNNKTTYGGGLAVATPHDGNKKVIFKNVCIKDNQAVYGGGIAIHSIFGQPITFIDCEILNNKAEEGSSIHSEVYSYWNKDNNGGIIQFFFTTFGLNAANDSGAYSFYRAAETKGQLGTIVLKGCLSIGNDTYTSNAEDYNYVATKEQALLDGVIDDDGIKNISNGLYPKKGSKADISIKSSVYQGWSEFLSDYTKNHSIGKEKEIKKNTTLKTILPIIIPASISLVLLVMIFVVLLVNHKQKKTQPIVNDESTKDSREECLLLLSDREKKVVELIIEGKRRKEIAAELNYSENTIKKDLTIIYSKLHVIDKYELILKYKELI